MKDILKSMAHYCWEIKKCSGFWRMDQHRSKVDCVWQVNMLDMGILLLGREQYVVINFHNKMVRFLNLYASNSSKE